MLQDLRVALRAMRQAPGFAAAAVLTLALAIGMATSVFSVVNAMLLRPLPYADSDRLAAVWTVNRASGRSPVSYDDFADWLRDSRTIENGALYSSFYKPIFSGVGEAERIPSLLVTHSYFAVLGAAPALGRFFLPAEDRDGSDDVVVLSNGFWKERFAGDAGVIGRKILLNSRPHTVVGVARADLLPLPPSLAGVAPAIYRPVGEPFDSSARSGRHLRAIVRLRRGATLRQAQAEIDVRCRDMARQNPKDDALLAATIVTLRGEITRGLRAGLIALEAAVLVLLLIACANIANLLLVKSSGRQREMAVRVALGANAGRLARMLLTESLVLGTLGGLGGLLAASWTLAGLDAVVARVLPDAGRIAIDGRVLLFSGALSLLAATIFGLAPVLRLNAARFEEHLRLGSRVSGDRRNRLRHVLASGQIAMALMLLICGGLLGRSFLRLRAVSPGFETAGVLTASISIPSVRYPEDEDVVTFYQRALDRVRRLPGVRSAAVTSVVPISANFDRTSFEIEGKLFAPGEKVSPDRYIVSPEYFDVLRIPLRQGRLFNLQDDAAHRPVCVISEMAARQWFAGESPLGRKVRAGSPTGFATSPFREVVGVVGDVAQYGLGLPATPQIYMPHAQYANRFQSLVVRTSGNPEALGGALQKAVFSVDPEQPLYEVAPLEEIVAGSIATRRVGFWMLAVFGGGALLLAAIGIYGVVSYTVAQRTAEFGVRIALGAQPGHIVRGALGSVVPAVAVGLAAGLAGSFGASRLIAGFLFGVSATDALTFFTLPAVLALIALAACYVPARRAARVDPIAALRSE